MSVRYNEDLDPNEGPGFGCFVTQAILFALILLLILAGIWALMQGVTDIMRAFQVRSLKSGKKDMDQKMYEAMKTDRHPQIQYQLTKFELAEGTKADQAEFDVETTGNLTIAGVTRRILREPAR